ncbi:CD63 antigen [Halotydeus destructor]|nr:CD63 antigen [Halotydeus destructor]
MVKGCGNNCMKYSLFAFNLLFVLIGGTLLGLGVFILVRAGDLRQVFETPDAVAILVVIIGFAIFVVAFFGCCGALQEARCLLYTYAVIVSIAFLLEIATAILIVVYSAKLHDYARDGMDHAVRNSDPSNPQNSVTQIMDNLQWNLKCCGARDRADWRNYHPAQYATKYPNSCCFNPLDSAGRTCGQDVQPFLKPCIDALDEYLKVFLAIVAGCILVIAVIQLIAACFACSIAGAVV